MADLTDEQRRVLLFMAVGEVRRLKDLAATASSNLRNAYKRAKSDGVTKRDIDDFIRLSAMDVNDVVAEQRRANQIAIWAGHGVQMTFAFDDDRKPLAAAEERGFAVGAAGEKMVAPTELSGRMLQAWSNGWHRGTAAREQLISERTERELAKAAHTNFMDTGEDAPPPARASRRKKDAESDAPAADEGEGDAPPPVDDPEGDEEAVPEGEEDGAGPEPQEPKPTTVPVPVRGSADDLDADDVDEEKVTQLAAEKAKRSRAPRRRPTAPGAAA